MPGDQSFRWVGKATLTGAAQLGYFTTGGMTIVRASTDADAAPEVEIQLTGIKTLTEGDFGRSSTGEDASAGVQRPQEREAASGGPQTTPPPLLPVLGLRSGHIAPLLLPPGGTRSRPDRLARPWGPALIYHQRVSRQQPSICAA